MKPVPTNATLIHNPIAHMSSSKAPTGVTIVNPVAGRGRGLKVFQRVKSLLQDLDTVFTSGPGEAVHAARKAVNDGKRLVVCIGGDGTINEVVNGLAHSNTSLAIIPAGTGNDLVRTLNIPTDPLSAAQTAMRMSTLRRLDLATANGRYFINVAGGGFDAEVAKFKNEKLKIFHGTIPFVLSALSVLSTYSNRFLSIEIDGHVYSGRALLFAAANGQYYAGGMQIAPEASMDDGLLDIIIGWDISRPQALALLPKVYSGAHMKHPRVVAHRGRKLTVTANLSTCIQVDGEITGMLPVTIEVAPAAISIVL